MASQRATYPAWIYRQSAALPYRERNGDLEVLLITSRKNKRWILPKGIVDPGFTPQASAAKEALEEAGVVGAMGSTSLGSYRRRKWGGTCHVDVYPLRVTVEMGDWSESGLRRRRWRPLATALRTVDDAGLREVIARLPDTARRSSHEAEPAERAEDDRRPPRLLYLLRHAKAGRERRDMADTDRPLTARGERDADRMNRYIAVADIRPTLVLCSSALRARQTLERVMPALGEQAVVVTSRDLYGRGARPLLDLVQTTDAAVSDVMLVGHNPGLRSFVSLLAGGGDDTARAGLENKFPTGALAILVFRGGSWKELGPDTCELHSLAHPGDIDVGAGR